MRVAIYSRAIEEDHYGDVQFFFDELTKQKIEPVLFHSFFEQINQKIRLAGSVSTFFLSEHLTDEIDFIISLGGDGTLLDTVTLVRNKNIPIMGINFGGSGSWQALAAMNLQQPLNLSGNALL
jgi:NAD+ kinase